MTFKPADIKLMPDGAQLLAQLNVLATSNKDPGFLADLAALVSKYQYKTINTIAPASLPDSRTPTETVGYKPTYHYWYGKFPISGGSTDWYGTKPPIIAHKDSFLAIYGIDFKQDSIKNIINPLELPQMAIGHHNRVNQSITFSTIIDERTVKSIVRQEVSGPPRPMAINECISCDDITLEQIRLGHAWLNPVRIQNLFIPENRLIDFSPKSLSILSQVFNYHPINFHINLDPEQVKKNLKESRDLINLDLPIEPGIITRKEFWLQHASTIASVMDNLRGIGEYESATDIPIIVHEKFGDTPHAKFEFALDLIEAVVILRGKFLPSWSASHVCPADYKNFRPSLSIISSDVCTRENLLEIDSTWIVDGNTHSPNTAVVIAYLEGRISLEVARKYFE
jgi:hypothetical protein